MARRALLPLIACLVLAGAPGHSQPAPPGGQPAPPGAQPARPLNQSVPAPRRVISTPQSGRHFATPETLAIQDDDFQNPGFLWVEEGELAWNTPEGSQGRSCASCHQDAAVTMRGVRARMPGLHARTNRVVTMEQQVNICRTDQMGAEPLPVDSRPMNAMTSYLALQSRGMPVSVDIAGAARPAFDAGEAYYNQRRGQLDLRCGSCHEDNPGRMLRADLLSQGMTNGFPTYRLREQRVIALQFRLQGCVNDVRGAPPALGSEDLNNLEFFLAWRAQGLPVEAPAVRR